tara:strand:- start:439 stop:630 length:192 start_codon:yes stop_codon:yes gene_type:complete
MSFEWHHPSYYKRLKQKVKAVRDMIRRSASKVTHSDTNSLDLSSYFDIIHTPKKKKEGTDKND